MLKRIYLIVGFVFLALVLPAQAQHRHGHYHRHYHWIAPVVVGGVVTYALTRPPEPVIVPQYQVIPQYPVMQGPIVLQPNQRIVCNTYQVHSSRYGVYDQQNCYIQQQ